MNLRKFKSRVQRMMVKARAIMKDKNKKNILKIIKETTIIAIKQRCLPTHYFTAFIYRKGIKNYLDYLNKRDGLIIQRYSHNPDTQQVLDNKLLFHEHFSKLGFRVPRRLAYNFNYLWFIDKETGLFKEEVGSIEKFVALMRSLFQTSQYSTLFAKPLLLNAGKGATKITQEMFSLAQFKKLEEVFLAIMKGCYIFQENVIQHPEMSRLNSSSLNTIRIVTFSSFRHAPEVVSAFLRMGRSGNIVDNCGQGGIFIDIDLETGKLNGDAITELVQGGATYSRHPDSGVLFKDFTIPHFSEVKKMACQAAGFLSEKLVGWDIGIMAEGPILIEGNSWFDLSPQDIAYGGLRRNHIFRRAMEEAGIKTLN
jgi:hypothetical protein